jgi:predicted O-methyltransferase YrrM
MVFGEYLDPSILYDHVYRSFFSRMAEVRFDHNVAVSGASNRVIKITGRSQEILRLLRHASYDVIYIDGSHRAVDVQADASFSWPLLKPSGVLIFDDYLWNMELPLKIGHRWRLIVF